MEQLSIRDWMILIGGMMIAAVLIEPGIITWLPEAIYGEIRR